MDGEEFVVGSVPGGPEFNRGGAMAPLGVVSDSIVYECGGSLRSFDRLLLKNKSLAVRLLSEGLRERVASLSSRERKTLEFDLQNRWGTGELHLPGEAWSSPGGRGQVGLSATRVDGEGWCVQMLLPSNFRVDEGGSLEKRMVQAGLDFSVEWFGDAGAGVWYAKGCLEMWTDDAQGQLASIVGNAWGMDELGRLLLRNLDVEFAPSEQSRLVDAVEGRRQLVVSDVDSGGGGFKGGDVAVCAGDARVASVVALAYGWDVDWFVTGVPGGEMGDGAVLIGAGYTRMGSVADAVSKVCESGFSPLHWKGGKVVAGESGVELKRAVEVSELGHASVACRREFVEYVSSFHRPVVVPEKVLERVHRGGVLGDEAGDFKALREVDDRWLKKARSESGLVCDGGRDGR